MRPEDIEADVNKLDKEAVCLNEISIVITDVGLRHGCLNSFVQNWLQRKLQNRNAVELETFNRKHEYPH